MKKKNKERILQAVTRICVRSRRPPFLRERSDQNNLLMQRERRVERVVCIKGAFRPQKSQREDDPNEEARPKLIQYTNQCVELEENSDPL